MSFRLRAQGATIPGRVSAMIIYAGMRERPDRVAIPIPFVDRAGLIFRPNEVELKCLYGIDGSTAFQRNDPAHPGCPAPDELCDAAHPEFQYGGMCGFDGWPIGAWAPKDLKKFLKMHALHGSEYKPPGFHSGYNEVIITSEIINAHLPRSIEAFFVLNEGQVGSDGVQIKVGQAHRDFLQQFQLTVDDVPLLLMNPSNWNEPFSELHGHV